MKNHNKISNKKPYNKNPTLPMAFGGLLIPAN